MTTAFFHIELPWHSPLQYFRRFDGQPWAHCLHAGQLANAASQTNRWSYIVTDPVSVFTWTNGQAYIDNAKIDGNLIDCLREFCAFMPELSTSMNLDKIPFIGGLVGYIGYEIGSIFEPCVFLKPSPYGFPDLTFANYTAILAFDRIEKRVFSIGYDKDHVMAIANRYQHFINNPLLDKYLPPIDLNVSEIGQTKYQLLVNTIREDILSGDYYQTNLSRRLRGLLREPYEATLAFARLMESSASSYGALLQLPDGAILSNSPEQFFSIEPNGTGNWKIKTAPIKGTRPRGQSASEDQKFGNELLNSQKDRAENIMIADLLRNDLSRICQPESVTETALCELMSLPHVHHLVSKIEGVLRPDKDIFDTLAALFPCGSITGAPKIESMRAIHRLEPSGRGPYCGAIGYIDLRGGAHFSVAIRTMMIEKIENEIEFSVPVGGGVTLASEPDSEFEETRWKARAFSELLML